MINEEEELNEDGSLKEGSGSNKTVSKKLSISNDRSPDFIVVESESEESKRHTGDSGVDEAEESKRHTGESGVDDVRIVVEDAMGIGSTDSMPGVEMIFPRDSDSLKESKTLNFPGSTESFGRLDRNFMGSNESLQELLNQKKFSSEQSVNVV